ncbi:phosphatase PAP2 family protein [Fructobacillus sp. M2-14]|uniref:Phosphatase PAP2 family protein n=1 Tax=Fructobacillus broussonetiae TaxID=2713173 RepID=A0ABS5QZ53_9LACO|nr:phosphatase PAP2 family protein [Fructobacillus broussonetiae]MBS9338466.1 phosphatase PAP2 family protein [Fructobacillus broussonetiae]
MPNPNHTPAVSRSTLYQDEPFKTRPIEKLLLTLFLSVGFVTLLIAAFFDQNITKAVMDRSSDFGHFFQVYGTKGPNIVLFVAFQLLAWYSFFKMGGKVLKFFMTTGFLGLSMGQILFGLNGYFGYTLATFINGTTKHVPDPKPGAFLFSLAVTAVISVLFYLGLRNKNDDDLEYLKNAAIVGIALFFVVSFVIGDLKLHWGRWRPFEMDGNFSQFTPWFHPNGSNGHVSFPSGHTTSGWMMLYLPFYFTRDNRLFQRIFTTLGIVLAITIALSRVRYGAHWLSDVTAASLIVGSLVFMASRLLKAHFVEE